MTLKLRSVSAFLVVSFLCEQVSFAAPEISPLKLEFGKENHLVWAKKELPSIPVSMATIEDAWQSKEHLRQKAGGQKINEPLLVYLLQDAHTNPSGQLNLSAVLDLLLKKEKNLKYVFLEAGTGNDSLSFLREHSSLDERKNTALSFLKKGLLHGEEYLDLTSDHTFTLWGVEDMGLYFKGLENYRYVASHREKFQAYLKKINQTIDTLKPKIYNPVLLEFEKIQNKFLKEEISLTDYFEVLIGKAKNNHIDIHFFPHLKALKNLKEKEERIDFKLANEEQIKAIASLPLKDQEELAVSGKEQAARLGSADHKEAQGFYTLLEEKLTRHVIPSEVRQRSLADESRNQLTLDPSTRDEQSSSFARDDRKLYPNLFKYFEYLKQSQTLNPKEILKEQTLLEEEILDHLVSTQDEQTLLKCQKTLRLLNKLFNLTLTPEEYEEYKAITKGTVIPSEGQRPESRNQPTLDPSTRSLRSLARDDEGVFTIRHLTGFLNKKIMDLKKYYERALFLEEGYEQIVKSSEEFYELTLQRDRAFIENMLAKLDHPVGAIHESPLHRSSPVPAQKAILITGGFHTPSLKALLKERNISYVSITPQVTHETNQKRYEEILLHQKIDPRILAPSPFIPSMLMTVHDPFATATTIAQATLAEEDNLAVAQRFDEKGLFRREQGFFLGNDGQKINNSVVRAALKKSAAARMAEDKDSRMLFLFGELPENHRWAESEEDQKTALDILVSASKHGIGMNFIGAGMPQLVTEGLPEEKSPKDIFYPRQPFEENLIIHNGKIIKQGVIALNKDNTHVLITKPHYQVFLSFDRAGEMGYYPKNQKEREGIDELWSWMSGSDAAKKKTWGPWNYLKHFLGDMLSYYYDLTLKAFLGEIKFSQSFKEYFHKEIYKYIDITRLLNTTMLSEADLVNRSLAMSHFDQKGEMEIDVSIQGKEFLHTGSFSSDRFRVAVASTNSLLKKPLLGRLLENSIFTTFITSLIRVSYKISFLRNFASKLENRLFQQTANRHAYVFDVNTGRSIFQTPEQEGSVNEAELSPDGKYLATVTGYSSQVDIWDVDNGKLHGQFTIPHDSGITMNIPTISSISWLADSEHVLLTSHTSNRAWLGDVRKNRWSKVFEGGHDRFIMQGLVSRNEKKIITIDDGGAVVVWDVDSAKIMRTIQSYRFQGGQIILSDDGKKLAVSSRNGSFRDAYWVELYDTDTGVLLHSFATLDQGVHFMVFSPDGKRFAAINRYHGLYEWNLETGELENAFFDPKLEAAGFSYSSDGQFLIVLDKHSLRFWNVKERILDHEVSYKNDRPQALVQDRSRTIFAVLMDKAYHEGLGRIVRQRIKLFNSAAPASPAGARLAGIKPSEMSAGPVGGRMAWKNFILDGKERLYGIYIENLKETKSVSVYLGEMSGRKVIVKKFKGILGRLLAKNTVKAHLLTEDLQGIPHFIGSTTDGSVVLEFVEGKEAYGLTKLPPYFFDQYAGLLEGLRIRGVVNLDFFHLKDVILSPHDLVYRIDLSPNLFFSEGKGLFSKLWNVFLERVVNDQRRHLAELKIKMAPESADAADRRLASEYMPIYGLYNAVFKFPIRTVGRLITAVQFHRSILPDETKSDSSRSAAPAQQKENPAGGRLAGNLGARLTSAQVNQDLNAAMLSGIHGPWKQDAVDSLTFAGGKIPNGARMTVSDAHPALEGAVAICQPEKKMVSKILVKLEPFLMVYVKKINELVKTANSGTFDRNLADEINNDTKELFKLFDRNNEFEWHLINAFSQTTFSIRSDMRNLEYGDLDSPARRLEEAGQQLIANLSYLKSRSSTAARLAGTENLQAELNERGVFSTGGLRKVVKRLLLGIKQTYHKLSRSPYESPLGFQKPNGNHRQNIQPAPGQKYLGPERTANERTDDQSRKNDGRGVVGQFAQVFTAFMAKINHSVKNFTTGFATGQVGFRNTALMAPSGARAATVREKTGISLGIGGAALLLLSQFVENPIYRIQKELSDRASARVTRTSPDTSPYRSGSWWEFLFGSSEQEKINRIVELETQIHRMDRNSAQRWVLQNELDQLLDELKKDKVATKILYVRDNPDLAVDPDEPRKIIFWIEDSRALLGTSLEYIGRRHPHGYFILAAQSYEDALRVFDVVPRVDLVVTDDRFPKNGDVNNYGIKMVEMTKTRYPRAPIITNSGISMEMDLKKAGYSDVEEVPKTAGLPKLNETIEKLLKPKGARLAEDLNPLTRASSWQQHRQEYVEAWHAYDEKARESRTSAFMSEEAEGLRKARLRFIVSLRDQPNQIPNILSAIERLKTGQQGLSDEGLLPQDITELNELKELIGKPETAKNSQSKWKWALYAVPLILILAALLVGSYRYYILPTSEEVTPGKTNPPADTRTLDPSRERTLDEVHEVFNRVGRPGLVISFEIANRDIAGTTLPDRNPLGEWKYIDRILKENSGPNTRYRVKYPTVGGSLDYSILIIEVINPAKIGGRLSRASDSGSRGAAVQDTLWRRISYRAVGVGGISIAIFLSEYLWGGSTLEKSFSDALTVTPFISVFMAMELLHDSVKNKSFFIKALVVLGTVGVGILGGYLTAKVYFNNDSLVSKVGLVLGGAVGLITTYVLFSPDKNSDGARLAKSQEDLLFEINRVLQETQVYSGHRFTVETDDFRVVVTAAGPSVFENFFSHFLGGVEQKLELVIQFIQKPGMDLSFLKGYSVVVFDDEYYPIDSVKPAVINRFGRAGISGLEIAKPQDKTSPVQVISRMNYRLAVVENPSVESAPSGARLAEMEAKWIVPTITSFAKRYVSDEGAESLVLLVNVKDHLGTITLHYDFLTDENEFKSQVHKAFSAVKINLNSSEKWNLKPEGEPVSMAIADTKEDLQGAGPSTTVISFSLEPVVTINRGDIVDQIVEKYSLYEMGRSAIELYLYVKDAPRESVLNFLRIDNHERTEEANKKILKEVDELVAHGARLADQSDAEFKPNLNDIRRPIPGQIVINGRAFQVKNEHQRSWAVADVLHFLGLFLKDKGEPMDEVFVVPSGGKSIRYAGDTLDSLKAKEHLTQVDLSRQGLIINTSGNSYQTDFLLEPLSSWKNIFKERGAGLVNTLLPLLFTGLQPIRLSDFNFKLPPSIDEILKQIVAQPKIQFNEIQMKEISFDPYSQLVRSVLSSVFFPFAVFRIHLLRMIRTLLLLPLPGVAPIPVEKTVVERGTVFESRQVGEQKFADRVTYYQPSRPPLSSISSTGEVYSQENTILHKTGKGIVLRDGDIGVNPDLIPLDSQVEITFGSGPNAVTVHGHPTDTGNKKINKGAWVNISSDAKGPGVAKELETLLKNGAEAKVTKKNGEVVRFRLSLDKNFLGKTFPVYAPVKIDTVTEKKQKKTEWIGFLLPIPWFRKRYMESWSDADDIDGVDRSGRVKSFTNFDLRAQSVPGRFFEKNRIEESAVPVVYRTRKDSQVRSSIIVRKGLSAEERHTAFKIAVEKAASFDQDYIDYIGALLEPGQAVRMDAFLERSDFIPVMIVHISEEKPSSAARLSTATVTAPELVLAESLASRESRGAESKALFARSVDITDDEKADLAFFVASLMQNSELEALLRNHNRFVVALKSGTWTFVPSVDGNGSVDTNIVRFDHSELLKAKGDLKNIQNKQTELVRGVVTARKMLATTLIRELFEEAHLRTQDIEGVVAIPANTIIHQGLSLDQQRMQADVNIRELKALQAQYFPKLKLVFYGESAEALKEFAESALKITQKGVIEFQRDIPSSAVVAINTEAPDRDAVLGTLTQKQVALPVGYVKENEVGHLVSLVILSAREWVLYSDAGAINTNKTDVLASSAQAVSGYNSLANKSVTPEQHRGITAHIGNDIAQLMIQHILNIATPLPIGIDATIIVTRLAQIATGSAA